jgi:hypothetical protein
MPKLTELTELSDDTWRNIIYFLDRYHPSSMQNISLINKRFHSLTLADQFNFKFFKENKHQYLPYSKKILPPLLKAEYLTPFHIRAGNHIIRKAMDTLKQGNFKEGDRLVKEAMQLHRSAKAVLLYLMLAEAGYYGQKNQTDNKLKELLIKKYKEYGWAERNLLLAECQTIENSKYTGDLLTAVQRYHWEIECFINDFKSYYQTKLSDKSAVFIDTSINQSKNIYKQNTLYRLQGKALQDELVRGQYAPLPGIKNQSFIDRILANRQPFHKDFDIYSYIGAAEPKPDAWHLAIDKEQQEIFSKIYPYLIKCNEEAKQSSQSAPTLKR